MLFKGMEEPIGDIVHIGQIGLLMLFCPIQPVVCAGYTCRQRKNEFSKSTMILFHLQGNIHQQLMPVIYFGLVIASILFSLGASRSVIVQKRYCNDENKQSELLDSR
jgi:hypothetical protein